MIIPDVNLFGAGIGGITAATHLAQKNPQVTFYACAQNVSRYYQNNTFLLPLNPPSASCLKALHALLLIHMKHTDSFFDFAAHIGLTKHLGGQEATRELIDRTRITPLSFVLDVGAGVGVTSCHLAKSMGCRVVAWILTPIWLTVLVSAPDG
jgi:hypothetical protein